MSGILEITDSYIVLELYIRTMNNEEKFNNLLEELEDKYGKATDVILERGGLPDKKAKLIYKF